MRAKIPPNDDIFDYLDGLLDAEGRSRVEVGAVNDPKIAEDLRALGAIRELVESLSRPSSPMDLAGPIVSRIEAERLRRSPTRTLARLRGAMPELWSGLKIAAVAAGLLAVASLPVTLPRFLNHEPVGPVVARTAPLRVPVPPTETPGIPLATTGASELASTAERAEPPPGSSMLRPDRWEVARDQENEKFRRLLDSPSLQKIFVVADRRGDDPSLRVDWILHDSPRKYANYARIDLVSELNPDPDRPGGASVYALVMDDREIDGLRKTLDRAFPFGTIEERAPRPELVTRLVDAGRVEVFEGTAVAELVEIRADTQASLLPGDTQIQLNPRQAPLRLPSEMMTGFIEAIGTEFPDDRAEPRVTEVESSKSSAKAERRAERSTERPSRSVVLIWVSRPIQDGVTLP